MSFRRDSSGDVEWGQWVRRHADLIRASGLPPCVFQSRAAWGNLLEEGSTTRWEGNPADAEWNRKMDPDFASNESRQRALTALVLATPGRGRMEVIEAVGHARFVPKDSPNDV